MWLDSGYQSASAQAIDGVPLIIHTSAFGRLRPFARGSFGSAAVAHEQPLTTHTGHSLKIAHSPKSMGSDFDRHPSGPVGFRNKWEFFEGNATRVFMVWQGSKLSGALSLTLGSLL